MTHPRARSWRDMDLLLLLVTAVLLVYGLVLVYSATAGPGADVAFRPSVWFVRQCLFVALGIGAMVGMTLLDYRLPRALAYHLYGVALLLLAAVLLAGTGDEEFGARRWLDMQLFPLQPSEIAKLSLIVALARFLEKTTPDTMSFTRVFASGLLVAPPVVLVYLQPDMGSSLSFLAIWLGMVIAAGARPFYLLILGAVSLLSLPLGWLAMKDYMRSRLITFVMTVLGADPDPFGEGYNILQARISIGSGGMFGRGLMKGTQTQLDYLRVKQSDFIFSVLAEELGFIGGVALLALFALLLFRIIRTGELAKDRFGRLTAFGIASMLFYQLFVNVGANLTLLPVTGIPLPLISYGGSSLITVMAALGLLQSIMMRRMRLRF